ncbi:TIR domain-containing protein [Paractinoplanes rishiriensis]|uniref:TIR domain-containing protein n=1 Tax=Paractinoplanes rishiriensis TaxID=1050105 RepID=UPI001942C544|nr:TIR domain-containing protein [Actinoplanes rishiriensis]
MDEVRDGLDFFISYANEDRVWATWIADQLEAAGYTTRYQAADFGAGRDFVHEMHDAVMAAERTIAVLSPAYTRSEFGAAEWRVAFARDPTGERGLLIPVRVEPCEPPGLLLTRVYVDLVGADNAVARERLIAAVAPGRPRAAPVDRPQREHTEHRLAEAVRSQWSREAQRRSTWRPAPLPVRWSPSGLPVQARPEVVADGSWQTTLTGDVHSIAEALDRLPHRQLVVLGEPGSGKTVLAILTVLALLDRPGAPVPVLFPLSSYVPAMPLADWLLLRLRDDYEFLADDEQAARRLLDAGRVLPVLDGLDEISAPLRATALRAIETHLVAEAPLILTCRTAEYAEAVGTSGAHLSRAAVVAIEPVGPSTAVDYLRRAVMERDEPRWQPLLDAVLADPAGPPAEALRTPLMLFLVQQAYADPASRPAELTGFESAGQIEEHLLESFVPAAYAAHHGPPVTATMAARWLRHLARHGPDLQLWQLRSRVTNLAVAAVIALTCGWYFTAIWGSSGGVFGAVAVFLAALAATFAEPRSWREFEADRHLAGTTRHQLRRYRLVAAGWAAVTGIAAGAAVSLWLGRGLGSGAAVATGYAVTTGLLLGLVSTLGSPWGANLASRLWWAVTGRLPFRLMRFVDDAHRRGVLRRIGASYQFRHARLHETMRGGRPAREPDRDDSPRPWPLLPGFIALPLARLFVLLTIIFTPVVFAAMMYEQVHLTYHAGVEPERATEASQCNVMTTGAPCFPVDILRWRLAGGRAATEFTFDRRRIGLPYAGLAGRMEVTDCPAARLEVTAVAVRPHADFRFVLDDRGAALSDFNGRLPADFHGLRLTFRRLDDRPCTATVNWRRPGISFDQLSDFRERLR